MTVVRIHAPASAVLAAVWLFAVAGTACGKHGPDGLTPRPGSAIPAGERLVPSARTEVLPHDPDDPAIWVHPTDPARSLILATDKHETSGGLFVSGLDDRTRQTVAPLDRPNNVDVEYGVGFGREAIDIAVVTERNQRRLRIFRLRPD
jgi:hypothetical protein